MSESCNHNCESCGQNCSQRQGGKPDFSVKPHAKSNIKKVYAIVSGKGGVGKSMVTSMLTVAMSRRGHHCAVLDADITGPSIPKAFGLHGRAGGNEDGILPVSSRTGIDIISTNLLLEHDTDPVVWRGPVIANMVTQFWSNVVWGDVDYMFIDMPPGTGDVPLTVFQSLAVDGIIIITSPQQLVSMIVAKAVKMAEMMHIPIVGLIENMSYFHCPDNGVDYKIFGESHIDEIAKQHNLPVLAKLPIDPAVTSLCDNGLVELYEGDFLDHVAEYLENLK